MSNELELKSIGWQSWFDSDDGILRSRERKRSPIGTLTVTSPSPQPAPLTPGVKPSRSPAPAKEPGLSELLQKAEHLFEAFGAHLPKRISDEELGDALEAIHKLIKDGQPRSKIHARILSTLFWVSAHAVQDYAHQAVGMEMAATGNTWGRDNS